MSFLHQGDATEYQKNIEQKFKRNDPSDSSVQSLLIDFLQSVPDNPFSKSNVHLIDFIETFGDFKIDEITTTALKQWLDQVQHECRVKDITMRGLKCEIDTFFNFLKEKEIISDSPLSTIYYKIDTQPLKSRNLLSKEDIENLLKELRDYSPGYLYPIIKMFTETAAKSSEVIELDWKQVDLDKGLILFERRDKSQARTLKISDELIYMLRLKNNKDGRVFMTYYKEPFTYEKLRRAIGEFKKKNLFKKDWVVADLRHSYAVNFLSSGGDIRDLQKALGHWNVYETKKLYAEAGKNQITKDVFNPFL